MMSYELPDKSQLQLKKQQIFDACACLFEPLSEQPSITQLMQRTVNSIPLELQGKLFKNVVLTGGSSLLEGFSQRILEEFKQKEVEIDVFGSKNRSFAAFQGASACALLSGFSGYYMKRADQ